MYVKKALDNIFLPIKQEYIYVLSNIMLKFRVIIKAYSFDLSRLGNERGLLKRSNVRCVQVGEEDLNIGVIPRLFRDEVFYHQFFHAKKIRRQVKWDIYPAM